MRHIFQHIVLSHTDGLLAGTVKKRQLDLNPRLGLIANAGIKRGHILRPIDGSEIAGIYIGHGKLSLFVKAETIPLLLFFAKQGKLQSNTMKNRVTPR
jgi:hypothetical protein